MVDILKIKDRRKKMSLEKRIERALKLAFRELGMNDAQIERKVGGVINKFAREISFDEWVEEKEFKNPETGNEVKFKSLPRKYQMEIREKYNSKNKGGEESKKDVSKDTLKLVAEDEGARKFLQDKDVREKNISTAVKEVESEGFLNKIKKGVKSFINAEDFSAFGDAYKKGDKAGMKKALPGMAKGILKATAAVAAVGVGVAVGGGYLGLAMKAKAVAGVATKAMGSAVSSMGTAASNLGAKAGAVGAYAAKEVGDFLKEEYKKNFSAAAMKEKAKKKLSKKIEDFSDMLSDSATEYTQKLLIDDEEEDHSPKSPKSPKSPSATKKTAKDSVFDTDTMSKEIQKQMVVEMKNMKSDKYIMEALRGF